MLSSEGSKLTRLILARHMLVCRAVEQSTSSDISTARLLYEHDARLRIAHVEAQIEKAWLRLEHVSPPKIFG
jgi:hypothetical protein